MDTRKSLMDEIQKLLDAQKKAVTSELSQQAAVEYLERATKILELMKQLFELDQRDSE